MKIAVETGWKGVEKGDDPFGACIVKEGKVVVAAHNTIKSTMDSTAHAEMNAIRKACEILNTVDLEGCKMYATFKPCSMCIEAIKRAGIKQVIYGADPMYVIYPVKFGEVDLIGGILLEECLELTAEKYPLK